MKTIINIDIDSDRTPQIKLGKPVEMMTSDDPEKAKELVLNDIVAVTETLCLLAETAIEKGYMPKDSMIRNLNNRIGQILG
jgi:hypothetical protein